MDGPRPNSRAGASGPYVPFVLAGVIGRAHRQRSTGLESSPGCYRFAGQEGPRGAERRMIRRIG